MPSRPWAVSGAAKVKSRFVIHQVHGIYIPHLYGIHGGHILRNACNAHTMAYRRVRKAHGHLWWRQLGRRARRDYRQDQKAPPSRLDLSSPFSLFHAVGARSRMGPQRGPQTAKHRGLNGVAPFRLRPFATIHAWILRNRIPCAPLWNEFRRGRMEWLNFRSSLAVRGTLVARGVDGVGRSQGSSRFQSVISYEHGFV